MTIKYNKIHQINLTGSTGDIKIRRSRINNQTLLMIAYSFTMQAFSCAKKNVDVAVDDNIDVDVDVDDNIDVDVDDNIDDANRVLHKEQTKKKDTVSSSKTYIFEEEEIISSNFNKSFVAMFDRYCELKDKKSVPFHKTIPFLKFVKNYDLYHKKSKEFLDPHTMESDKTREAKNIRPQNSDMYQPITPTLRMEYCDKLRGKVHNNIKRFPEIDYDYIKFNEHSLSKIIALESTWDIIFKCDDIASEDLADFIYVVSCMKNLFLDKDKPSPNLKNKINSVLDKAYQKFNIYLEKALTEYLKKPDNKSFLDFTKEPLFKTSDSKKEKPIYIYRSLMLKVIDNKKIKLIDKFLNNFNNLDETTKDKIFKLNSDNSLPKSAYFMLFLLNAIENSDKKNIYKKLKASLLDQTMNYRVAFLNDCIKKWITETPLFHDTCIYKEIKLNTQEIKIDPEEIKKAKKARKVKFITENRPLDDNKVIEDPTSFFLFIKNHIDYKDLLTKFNIAEEKNEITNNLAIKHLTELKRENWPVFFAAGDIEHENEKKFFKNLLKDLSKACSSQNLSALKEFIDRKIKQCDRYWYNIFDKELFEEDLDNSIKEYLKAKQHKSFLHYLEAIDKYQQLLKELQNVNTTIKTPITITLKNLDPLQEKDFKILLRSDTIENTVQRKNFKNLLFLLKPNCNKSHKKLVEDKEIECDVCWDNVFEAQFYQELLRYITDIDETNKHNQEVEKQRNEYNQYLNKWFVRKLWHRKVSPPSKTTKKFKTFLEYIKDDSSQKLLSELKFIDKIDFNVIESNELYHVLKNKSTAFENAINVENVKSQEDKENFLKILSYLRFCFANNKEKKIELNTLINTKSKEWFTSSYNFVIDYTAALNKYFEVVKEVEKKEKQKEEETKEKTKEEQKKEKEKERKQEEEEKKKKKKKTDEELKKEKTDEELKKEKERKKEELELDNERKKDIAEHEQWCKDREFFNYIKKEDEQLYKKFQNKDNINFKEIKFITPFIDKQINQDDITSSYDYIFNKTSIQPQEYKTFINFLCSSYNILPQGLKEKKESIDKKNVTALEIKESINEEIVDTLKRLSTSEYSGICEQVKDIIPYLYINQTDSEINTMG